MYLPSLSASALPATSVVAKQCQSVSVPITGCARNRIFDVATLRDNHHATVFFVNLTNPRGNFSNEVLLGYQTIRKTYDISVKFCRPDTGYGQNLQFFIHAGALFEAFPSSSDTDLSREARLGKFWLSLPPTIVLRPFFVRLQEFMLNRNVQGVGFDKTYWDLSYNSYNYSYIDIAIVQFGFSTLSIDCVGIGNSSIAGPLSIIQIPTELSAIYELTRMLRHSSLPNVPWAFSKIVHVGHSLGSILSYNHAAMDPTAGDGLILTGFTHNFAHMDATFDARGSELARNNQPRRVGDLPTGYLTWTKASILEKTYLYSGSFDPGILQSSESTKEPFTAGEILNLGASPSTVPEFQRTGPGSHRQ